MLKSARFWIGLIISAICLYFAFQGIDFGKLFDALREMNYAWILFACALWCVSYAGRVFRWQLLFAPQKMRLNKIFHALNIGYFLSNLLPARFGDVVRAILIGEFEGVSKMYAFSTIVVERISDGLTVVLLLAVSALFVPALPDWAQQGALGMAVTGVVGIIFLVVLSFHKDRGLKLLHRITAPLPFLQISILWKWLESLIDGFAILRSPRPIFGVAVWALYAWTTGGILYWIAMLAMNLRDVAGNPLPIAAGFLVMTVTSLVVVIPSSPGYVGVFHYFAVLTLTTIFKTDNSAALSYAIVIHAVSYLMLTILGIFSIWKEGLTYQRLQNIQTQTAPSEQNP